jgi:hypothetical protein
VRRQCSNYSSLADSRITIYLAKDWLPQAFLNATTYGDYGDVGLLRRIHEVVCERIGEQVQEMEDLYEDTGDATERCPVVG